MSVAGPVTKEVEVKEDAHITDMFDMTVPAVAPRLGLQVIEEMITVSEAMYPTCSFQNSYFQEPVDEH